MRTVELRCPECSGDNVGLSRQSLTLKCYDCCADSRMPILEEVRQYTLAQIRDALEYSPVGNPLAEAD